MKFGFGSSAEKNGVPRIDRIAPAAAIPGGEIVNLRERISHRAPARAQSCILAKRMPA